MTLTGGTGKAKVESPCTITVSSGVVTAAIRWSSSNYDYMRIGDTRYDFVNQPGEKSVFLIPVSVFDAPMNVIADTVAMSEPHEIEYTLFFDSSTIQAVNG